MKHECPVCLQKFTLRRTCVSHLRLKHNFSQEMSVRVNIRIFKEEEAEIPEKKLESSKNDQTPDVKLEPDFFTVLPIADTPSISDKNTEMTIDILPPPSAKPKEKSPKKEAKITKPKSSKVCEYCEKVFLDARDKKVHIESVHLKIRHNCPLCPKQYTARKTVVAHLVQHHGFERFRFTAKSKLKIF